jgi:hypothetical protein
MYGLKLKSRERIFKNEMRSNYHLLVNQPMLNRIQ